ncbi:hypothetical protein Tco_0964460 [Tanacetum coccineum]
MLVQAQEEVGEGSANPIDPHHTPTDSQPSTSQPQQKLKSRKSKIKITEVPYPSDTTTNVPNKEHVLTPSNDPPLSVIMKSLVKKKQKGAILELKRRHLKKVPNCNNTPYPTRKIRRICASSSQERVLINSLSGVSIATLYAVLTAVTSVKDMH